MTVFVFNLFSARDSSPALSLPDTAGPERKYLQFDGLRAFAVGGVLYHHWVYNVVTADTVTHWYQRLLMVPLGDLGVSVFFLLSGFLITEILLQSRACKPGERRHFLRAFYVRRSLRIFPIYFLTLAVMLSFSVAPFRQDIWWFICYATNVLVFLKQHWIGMASHLWTLAVEEQFYLFWPLLAVFFSKRFEVLAVVFVIGSLSTRLALAWIYPSLQFIEILPLISMEALALGGLLALRGKSSALIETVATRLAWGLPVMYLVSAMGISGRGVDLLLHLCVIAFSAAVVARAARGFSGPVGRILSLSAVRYFGLISYGLYLYHNFAGLIARPALHWLGIPYNSHFLLRLMLLTLITVTWATLSWVIIERPINRLKRHYPYFSNRPH